MSYYIVSLDDWNIMGTFGAYMPRSKKNQEIIALIRLINVINTLCDLLVPEQSLMKVAESLTCWRHD